MNTHVRHRRRVATVLAAAVAAATILIGAPAHAVPAVPSDVFDPESVSWRSHRDQSSAGFAATFAKDSGDGYLIIDLEIDVFGSDYRVGSVWQKNTDGRGWQELRDLSGSQFNEAWLDARRRNLRLTEQETYYVDGRRRFAGVWVENVEQLGWASYRGLTSAEAVAAFNYQRGAGRMPIDIDQYLVDGSMRYSMIWVDNAENLEWELHSNLTVDEFWDVHYSNHNFGSLRLLAFESVKVGSVQRYTGIWVEHDDHPHSHQIRVDLTSDSFDALWRNAVISGYRMVSYDTYETPDGIRYAVAWRDNT